MGRSTSPGSGSAAEDVSVDDPLPFDPHDDKAEPEHPTWLWQRVPSARPDLVIWRRCFAGEEPPNAVDLVPDVGLPPVPGLAKGEQRQPPKPDPERGEDGRDVQPPGATAEDATTDAPAAIKVEEAAAILGIDRNTLYAMLKRGEGPPARRCGTGYRLDRAAVREWLRAGDPPPLRRRRAG